MSYFGHQAAGGYISPEAGAMIAAQNRSLEMGMRAPYMSTYVPFQQTLDALNWSVYMDPIMARGLPYFDVPRALTLKEIQSLPALYQRLPATQTFLVSPQTNVSVLPKDLEQKMNYK
jgi:hypothetical protein